MIKYERDIVVLRKAALAKRKEVEVAGAEKRQRVWSEGAWVEEKVPLALTGVSALQMPVEIRCVDSGVYLRCANGLLMMGLVVWRA